MRKGVQFSAAVHHINEQMVTKEEEEIQKWIDQMFDRADKDQKGSLSLDDFLYFLKVIVKEEIDLHKEELREAAVKSIEQNEGRLMSFEHQGKMVNISVPSGLDASALRSPRGGPSSPRPSKVNDNDKLAPSSASSSRGKSPAGSRSED